MDDAKGEIKLTEVSLYKRTMAGHVKRITVPICPIWSHQRGCCNMTVLIQQALLHLFSIGANEICFYQTQFMAISVFLFASFGVQVFHTLKFMARDLENVLQVAGS